MGLYEVDEEKVVDLISKIPFVDKFVNNKLVRKMEDFYRKKRGLKTYDDIMGTQTKFWWPEDADYGESSFDEIIAGTKSISLDGKGITLNQFMDGKNTKSKYRFDAEELEKARNNKDK